MFNLIKSATGKAYRCAVCGNTLQTKASAPEAGTDAKAAKTKK